MTVRALLEPILGFATANGSDDSPHGMNGQETVWMVHLSGWQPGWGDLPDGIRQLQVDATDHCAGRLSRRQLDGWIARMQKSGHNLPAASLETSLQAHTAANTVWQWGSDGRWRLDLSRPRIMGIVNVTHDSFSGDGTKTVERAIIRGLEMAADGADILDVGGESTRPGSQQVTDAEELSRVVPVVRGLSDKLSIPISIDSSKPAVIAAALDAGAAIINDVTALRGVEEGKNMHETMALLAKSDCPVILMHMLGKPATMQDDPEYGDVLSQVYDFLARRIAFCVTNGIARERLLVDTGIGFGKTAGHNLELLRRQRVFRGLGVPILLGVSRKRIVGTLTGEATPAKRDVGSHMLAALGYFTGAQIFRVHDVKGASQALSVANGWWYGLNGAANNG